MKKYFELILVALLVVGAMIYGLVCKLQYTDIMSEKDAINDFQVAQTPGMSDWLESILERSKKLYEDAPYVIKCKSMGEPVYFAGTYMLEVSVEEVFKGEGIDKGEKIYLSRTSLYVYPDSKRIDMSFANFMKPGEEYIVFIGRKFHYPEARFGKIYLLIDDVYPAPYFCYSDDFTRNILPITAEDGSTYVSYEGVKDNEFFATTQEEMDLLYEFKDWVFETYAGGR